MSAPRRIPLRTMAIGTRMLTSFVGGGLVFGGFVDVDAQPAWLRPLARQSPAAGVGRPVALIAPISRCASSTVILPCATMIQHASGFVVCVVSPFPQVCEVDEGRRSRSASPRSSCESSAARYDGWSLGLGFWIDLGKGQERADAIEAVLDRGVADTEELLHLLDGAVAADERGDEDLVLAGELGQRRELEAPLDGDVLVDEPDPFDFEGGASGQPG